MTVSQKVQIVTFDQGPSLSDVTVKSLLTDSTVTGGTADSCPEIATDAGVYVAEFVNADAAALIPAGTYRLRAVIGGAPLNRYVTLKGVDGEVAYSTDVPPSSSSGISVANVTKSLDDTGPITFSWPVTGATITGQVSIGNGAYQAVQGTFAFLRTDEPGIHYYTLSFDADDRPTAEGTAHYKLIDGSGIRGYINLSMNVSSGGGEADWTETEREQIRYRLGLDGDNSAPVGVTPDPIVVTPGTGNSTTGYYTVLDKNLDPEPGVTVYAKMLDAYDTDTGFIYSGEVLTSVSNAYGVCEFTMIKGASYRCWRTSPTPTAPISLIVVPLDAGTTTPLKSLVRI